MVLLLLTAWVSATIFRGLPAPVATARQEGRAIRVSWQEAGDADGYIVERSTQSGGQPDPIAKDVKDRQFVDNKAIPATAYYYRVIAVRGGRESPPSNEAQAQVGTIEIDVVAYDAAGDRIDGITQIVKEDGETQSLRTTYQLHHVAGDPDVVWTFKAPGKTDKPGVHIRFLSQQDYDAFLNKFETEHRGANWPGALKELHDHNPDASRYDWPVVFDR
jgi:hypothetical protein